MLNAADVLSTAIETLIKHPVQFKYVKEITTLCKMNAGVFGYSQVGKCLVVYMPTPIESLVEELKHRLARFADCCPAVPCARPFGAGLPMYYRYGAYAGETLDIKGEIRPDTRVDARAAVPEGLQDDLARFTTAVKSDPAVRSFLLRYPVFNTLSQRGKGGIFLALNFNSDYYQEVVLKMGYPNGQVQPDGSDGCTLLRRELEFLRSLQQRGLPEIAPRLIDSFEDGRRVLEVIEFLSGPSLLLLALEGTLELHHVTHCWESILRVHRHGLFLGDVKLANFMLDEAGHPKIIDFETSGVLGKTPSLPIKTFDLYNPVFAKPEAFDLAHFLVSILFAYDAQNHREDCRVNVSSYLNKSPKNAVEHWALDQLAQVLSVG